MSRGGRKPGPIRRFTIECAWPMQPALWRTAVREVDEKVARRSAVALRSMRHPFRVTVCFLAHDKARTPLGKYLVSQWDRLGRIQYVHTGEMRRYMPLWALGEESLEREKKDAPTAGAEQGA